MEFAMLNTLLTKLGLGDGAYNMEPDHRRKYIRLAGARAAVEIGGHAFPIRDWSQGGFYFDIPAGADLGLREGDWVVATVRFAFPHQAYDVQKKIRIVRKGARGVAAEFAPMTTDDLKQFTRIIDSHHAESFLASQQQAEQEHELRAA